MRTNFLKNVNFVEKNFDQQKKTKQIVTQLAIMCTEMAQQKILEKLDKLIGTF